MVEGAAAVDAAILKLKAGAELAGAEAAAEACAPSTLGCAADPKPVALKPKLGAVAVAAAEGAAAAALPKEKPPPVSAVEAVKPKAGVAAVVVEAGAGAAADPKEKPVAAGVACDAAETVHQIIHSEFRRPSMGP